MLREGPGAAKAPQGSFGASELVWRLRARLAPQGSFGASGLVWRLRVRLAPQGSFGASGFVWRFAVRFCVAPVAKFTDHFPDQGGLVASA